MAAQPAARLVCGTGRAGNPREDAIRFGKRLVPRRMKSNGCHAEEPEDRDEQRRGEHEREAPSGWTREQLAMQETRGAGGDKEMQRDEELRRHAASSDRTGTAWMAALRRSTCGLSKCAGASTTPSPRRPPMTERSSSVWSCRARNGISRIATTA